MHRLMVGLGLVLLASILAPGMAAAQSWDGSGGAASDMPPSLIAPAQTPGSTTTKVGSSPDLYNQAGELPGSSDTNRYAPVAVAPPVQVAAPDGPAGVDAPQAPSALADPPDRH